MRLVRYMHEGEVGIGVRQATGVAPTGYSDMLAFIQSGDAALATARAVASRGEVALDYREQAPVPNPGKILFSGVNYRSHLEENPAAILPTYPQFFAKLPSSVIGPGEAIRLPEPASQVDYEVELAVVIGKKASRTTLDNALEHVFGYTVVNDVSGRDVQFADNQITTGKGFDTFCPMGPEIVLADEIPNPSQLHVASYVNGECRQHASTADMLFSVEQIITFLSAHITLYPGDIISTGTPAGVGCFRQPPLYLKPGDVVKVVVEEIGCLVNPVEAAWIN
jgi:2-keto-4-pentenoate hydratase/2-oxohepta-3-ene-1,7-dioic acid hydratase in catechol pathway